MRIVSLPRFARFICIVMVLLFGATMLVQSKETPTQLSNETLDNVIYADTNSTEDVYAAVELGVLSETDVDTTEEVTFEAIKGAETVYSLERAAQIAAGNAKFSFNPYEKSNLTVEQYNNMLKGTGLEGEGQSYYDMEQEYGVNGLFAVSVALHESALGFKRINTNNCYGMRGNKGWMAFSTLRENIMYFGKLMNKPSYKGKGIETIAKVYCPPTPESWAENIRAYMSRYYEKR